jgi:hypothetical protein
VRGHDAHTLGIPMAILTGRRIIDGDNEPASTGDPIGRYSGRNEHRLVTPADAVAEPSGP